MDRTDPFDSVPASNVKHHHAYFSPAEVEYFADKQRGRLSHSQEDKARQQACGFIEAVGAKVGFPRKTIATAQQLYHRFHLFYPRKDFGYHDVALAALYVSAKMHDTLKKPRELVMVAYAIRFPELLARNSTSLTGEVDMDPATVEHDRQHLLAVERLILETICFNFTSRMPFPYVVKLGREIKAPKKLIKFAWRLAVDSNRTLAPLQYPPHAIALACLFLAALLANLERESGVLLPPATPVTPMTPEQHVESDAARRIAHTLGETGTWERLYNSRVEDLEAVAHLLVDLLIQASQQASSHSLNTSPQTPSSPSPHPSPRAPVYPNHPSYLNNQGSASSNGSMALPPHLQYDALLKLKIGMREREHAPRRVRARAGAGAGVSPGEAGAEGRGAVGEEGRNGDGNAGGSAAGAGEGTVRFMFGPPR